MLAKWDQFRFNLQKLIEEGMQRGEFRQDLRADIVAFAVLGMCNWSYSRYNPEGKVSEEDLIQIYVALVLNGPRTFSRRRALKWLLNYRFSYPIRVRYSEIDGQKIVFNARYLTYIDMGTTEYFRHVLGDHWLQWAENDFFDLVLAKVTVEFKQPVRLDDVINVYCRVVRLGTSSITLTYTITRDGDILAHAEAIQVCYSVKGGKSKPIPKEIRTKIEQFEHLS